MARKRMIDPGFWTDEKLGTLTPLHRLLFMGLISNADDEGRLQGHPALIKSTIFPYDVDITIGDVQQWLNDLHEKRIIRIYMVDGQTYIHVTNFLKYQQINRPTPSRLPAPPDNDGDSISFNTHEELIEYSLNTHGELTPNRKENNRKEKEEEENRKETEGKCEGEPAADAAGECDLAPAEKSSDTTDDGAQSKKTGKGEEYTPEFEEFWSYYPRRIEKKTAFRAWKARLKEKVSAMDMIKACINYASYCQIQHIESRFIKHPSTFLGPDKPYEEFINGPPEPIQNKASPGEPKGWSTLRALYAKYQQEEGRI